MVSSRPLRVLGRARYCAESDGAVALFHGSWHRANIPIQPCTSDILSAVLLGYEKQ
jgi:hypothetical protein